MTDYTLSLTIGAMEKLDTFPLRLRWARERAKLTQPQLAQLCGWDSQSRISHYERGRREPRPEDLTLIAKALRSRINQITAGWLQWGEGPIAVDQGQPLTLEEIAVRYDAAIAQLPRVPLISWVQAGNFAEIEDPFPPGEADEWYPYPKRDAQHVVALRVDGESMTAPFGKSYPDGSIIFVNLEQRTPSNGQRIIARQKGEQMATFKVYVEEGGKKWLRPLNPQYPAMHGPFQVVGTVVGKWEDE